MNPQNDNLIVLKRMEILFNRIYKPLLNFPKHERHPGGLVSEIKLHCVNMMKYASLGNSVKSKRTEYLSTADGHVESLNILLKQAKTQRYLSKGFFAELDKDLTNIKGMIVNLLKYKTK